jgi:predicted AAA+ superfamily ATPase
MTIITGPRGSGRTTVLVQQFLADQFGVYCVPAQECKA